MPRFSIIAALLMVAAFIAWGPTPEALVYDRLAIEQGEHWRWLSAHLVHTDGDHLRWNLLALLLIGWLFEPALIWRSGLAGIVCIDVYLAAASPLDRYCGLSGALNASLVGSALLAGHTRSERLLGCLAALLCLGKILFEGWTETAVFSHTSWPSDPSIHLAGWIGGVGYALVWRLRLAQPGTTFRLDN